MDTREPGKLIEKRCSGKGLLSFLLGILARLACAGLCFFFGSMVVSQELPKTWDGPKNEDEIRQRDARGVCPPFELRDVYGRTIDPVHNINASEPYSPRATCGACHNYDRITAGFHFQQGLDEMDGARTEELRERYPWLLSPGDYGGRW